VKVLLDCHACSYTDGLALQEQVRAALPNGVLHGLAFEHPPTFTFGRHATPAHLLLPREEIEARGVAVVETERGGEVTYHGPGQLVLYPLLRLGRLAVKRWVWLLEEAMIGTLATIGVQSQRGDGPGIFTATLSPLPVMRERDRVRDGSKIGFIGLRIRDGVSTHGISLNLGNDLAPFTWMNPCGAAGLAVTSVAAEAGTSVEWRNLARTYMDTLGALLIGEAP